MSEPAVIGLWYGEIQDFLTNLDLRPGFAPVQKI